VLAVLGIVQLKLAGIDATLGVITLQLEPLLVLYSNFTVDTFALVQVIFWLEPISYTWPPFGLVIATLGITILKTALLWSVTKLFDASLTLTRALTVAVLGTLQLNVPPEAAVLPMI
jgi:hypothetical protein